MCIQNGLKTPAVFLEYDGVKWTIHVGSKNYTTYKKFCFCTYYAVYQFNTIIIP